MTRQLHREGLLVNHKGVSRLMKVMGLEAISPKRSFSQPLSNTLEAEFCCQALKQALNQALPEIHNSDQGSQLTGEEYLHQKKPVNL